MIKILIINVGSIFGGIERYTLDLIDVLPRNMFEVHLAVREDGMLREHLDVDKDNVLVLPMGKKDMLASMFSLRRYVKQNRIQIVQCNSNNAMFLASLIQEKFDDVKKVAVIHGDVMIDQAAKGRQIADIYCWLETTMLKQYKHCIAVSQSIKHILTERGVKEETIKVIHNGITPVQYTELPDYYAKPMKVCNVGNLMLPKGQITLLKAICVLREKHPEVEISCDIYGEGPYREMLEQYIKDNNLDCVHLCGFCKGVRMVLNSYAVYVQPSLYESFGLALVEAMNAGCCVVASEVGGMKEIVETGNTGFLFEAEDSKRLAHILLDCYTDRVRTEHIGRNARQKALKQFTVAAMGEKMQQYYKEMVRA